MPYTVDSPKLPANVKNLSPAKRKMWVAVWNSIFAKCQEEGADNCEEQAFRVANGVVKRGRFMTWVDSIVDIFKRGLESQIVDMEPDPLQMGHAPVSRSAATVIRQNDGSFRLVLIAATSVLNRVLEVDSAQLFDNMIARAKETDFYPIIDLLHLGRYHEEFEIGQIDFLARSGVVYIQSGILDTSKILGRLVAEDIETRRSGINWGCSIEYFPLDGETETIDVGGEIEVEVFKDGLNTRIALLPEEEAASWFTGVVKERTMELNDRVKENLRKLFSTDEEFEQFWLKVDGVNERVQSEDIVHRSKEDVVEDILEEADAATETEEAPVEAPKQRQVEIDDALVGLIADEVIARSTEESALLGIQTALEAISAQIQGVVERQDKFDSRLGSMEEDEEIRRERWKADLPSSVDDAERIVVTHRASRNETTEREDELESMATLAEQTLSKIPTRRGGRK